MGINEKIKLSIPVLVEGKYDKIALSSVIDTVILTTDGFGIFNSAEKRALIKKLSENGLIVLCDSDRAGSFIRSRIANFVQKDKLYQLYTPQITGKEKRKSAPSKDGFLGVEGVGATVLYELFSDFVKKHPEAVGDKALARETITKTDFYFAGLSGAENSSEKRDALAKKLGLPNKMTANALLSAVNMLQSREEFFNLINNIYGKEIL